MLILQMKASLAHPFLLTLKFINEGGASLNGDIPSSIGLAGMQQATIDRAVGGKSGSTSHPQWRTNAIDWGLGQFNNLNFNLPSNAISPEGGGEFRNSRLELARRGYAPLFDSRACRLPLAT